MGQRKTDFIIEEGAIYGDFKCIGTIHDKGFKYIMRCEKCGKIKHMLKSTIKRNCGLNHRSCGKGKGVSFDPDFYHRWQSMRARTSPNFWCHEQYYDRGINSDEFASFIDFYNALYPSWIEHVKQFGAKDTSLDRIDTDLPYTKSNCRWVCMDEQKGNLQKTVYFTVTDLKTNTVTYHKNATKYAFENHLPNYILEVINKNKVYKQKLYTRITKDEYALYNSINNTFIK